MMSEVPTVQPSAFSFQPLAFSLQPSVWRDSTHSPLMVGLPSGEFCMGESAGDKFANDTERPAHPVRIGSGIAIGRFPVLEAEFGQFRPDHFTGNPLDWPVAHVNWLDAVAYCRWLSAQTARAYRLPSEAEWEYACRAASRTPFAWGNDLSAAEANYLYDESGLGVGLGRRTASGSYPPNAFGLCDLHGNVAEWTEDTWHPNYQGAPDDGKAWVVPGERRRVVRGGAWDYLPRLLRSSWRDWQFENHRADNLGFRVAADCPAAPTRHPE